MNQEANKKVEYLRGLEDGKIQRLRDVEQWILTMKRYCNTKTVSFDFLLKDLGDEFKR